MTGHTRFTSEQLENAYLIAARIVAEHGDLYLPIFERLHDESLARKSNDALMLLAAQAASGYHKGD